MAKKTISFRVPGAAQPRGSKRGFAVQTANGKTRIAMVDSCKKSGEWMDRVSVFAAKACNGNPLDGPVSLWVYCYFARPQSHYGTGKNAGVVKDSAPQHKTTTPDCSKLLRGIEDALTGIAYKDDRQIRDTHCYKFWSETGLDFVDISIEEIA